MIFCKSACGACTNCRIDKSSKWPKMLNNYFWSSRRIVVRRFVRIRSVPPFPYQSSSATLRTHDLIHNVKSNALALNHFSVCNCSMWNCPVGNCLVCNCCATVYSKELVELMESIYNMKFFLGQELKLSVFSKMSDFCVHNVKMIQLS